MNATTTATKSSKTTKVTKAATKSTPKVLDRRVWSKPEGRKDGKVPTATTMTVDYDVRDALWDYSQSMGFSRMSDALAALLADAGYDLTVAESA